MAWALRFMPRKGSRQKSQKLPGVNSPEHQKNSREHQAVNQEHQAVSQEHQVNQEHQASQERLVRSRERLVSRELPELNLVHLEKSLGRQGHLKGMSRLRAMSRLKNMNHPRDMNHRSLQKTTEHQRDMNRRSQKNRKIWAFRHAAQPTNLPGNVAGPLRPLLPGA